MIKFYKLSSLIVLFTLLSFLNQVHAQFLFTLLGNGIFDSGNGIAVDKDENIYITGSFQESVDFDPSEREFLLEAIDDDQNYDIFIASYTKEGELRFAFNLGGKRSISYGKEIVLDSQGNIYITGIFRGIVDFDPSNREEELVSSAQGTNFFASYNNNGEFRFVMPLGYGISAPSEQAIAPQLEIDEQDNLYLYHFFFGTIDFDPSEEVFELSNQSSTYVASYSNNGNLRYAKDLNISINFNGNVLHGFSADHTGNSYIIGDFVGTVDFDPSDNVNELSAGFGERNIFVLSLDENGDFRYVFAIETIESASPFGILDLKIDQNGNLHIIGMMAGKMDFDPSLDVFELDVLTSFDMFYASYDREQSLRHAFLIGNEETIFDDFKVASPVNLDLDAAGNVYISGSFGGDGKVDFDPSSEVFEL
ncbi:MAG: SBBP repeat-containing protein, partial [Bacteroidota bacterium]